MPQNVITIAGTTEQRVAVTAAAAAALTSATSAQTKAAAGDPPFTTYFGPASSDAKSFVSGIYGSIASLLQTATISFDFFDDPWTFYLPNVWTALQLGAATTAVTFRVASNFWPAYVIDAPAASTQLAVSMINELSIFVSDRSVDVRVGVFDDAAAAMYASFYPDDARRLAASYAAFARPLVQASPIQARDRVFVSPVLDRVGHASEAQPSPPSRTSKKSRRQL